MDSQAMDSELYFDSNVRYYSKFHFALNLLQFLLSANLSHPYLRHLFSWLVKHTTMSSITIINFRHHIRDHQWSKLKGSKINYDQWSIDLFSQIFNVEKYLIYMDGGGASVANSIYFRCLLSCPPPPSWNVSLCFVHYTLPHLN